VRYARPVTCVECKGSGAQPGSEPHTCVACNGSGQKVHKRQETRGHGTVSVQQISACPNCRGTGVVIDKPCSRCHGVGEEQQEEKLKVTIPAGVEEGTALRIAHHGLPSKTGNGVPGDLYVFIYSQPDSRFERHGADLWTSVVLSVPDVVLGTKLKIPTLKGVVEVKVPPGTQTDEILRLRGKGLPGFDGGDKGDLNIRLQVQIPQHPSSEERSLYEQLRELSKETAAKKQWWRKNP
jgi:molecular chaperone DnaJ